MGKSSPSPPPPPDPRVTAGAQTAENIGTAIANAQLGNVNQVTPDGTLTFTQTGSFPFRDPNTGRVFNIPRFTATQRLSPEQAAIQAQNRAAQLNLATLGKEQSGRLQDFLSQPVNLDNAATEARLLELRRQRLDPVLAEQRERFASDLASRGIKRGSAAFDREMTRLAQSENDAINNLILSGRGQAVQEALAARNQPINEITALLSGSQVSQPSFVNAAQPQIPTTDVAGIINQDFQNRFNIFQQQQANRSDTLGGLFSLGGQLGSSAILASALPACDRRLKTGIRRVGQTDAGLPIYTFRYRGSDVTQIGVMADELERVNPEAVVEVNGIQHVNYAQVE